MRNPKFNTPVAELEADAKFYMNELVYLSPKSAVELEQGRGFASEFAVVIEALELNDFRQSFIDLCWGRYSQAITKFA